MGKRTIDSPPGTLCLRCGKWFAFTKYGVGHKWHYNRKKRYCGRECANAAQIKAPWGTDKNGYQVHYRSDGKGGRSWVMQHRKVMEQHLGRKLFPHETVHHKDGNRANNRLSNLELWSSKHGKGQRVEDKIEFCLSFLKEYGYELAVVSDPTMITPTTLGRAADLPKGMPCINMLMQ
jgi:hypothetical protein